MAVLDAAAVRAACSAAERAGFDPTSPAEFAEVVQQILVGLLAKDFATRKQVGYALHLLRENGYPTDRMGARHKGLPGATMNARRGTVREWLAGLDRGTASRLITRLK